MGSPEYFFPCGEGGPPAAAAWPGSTASACAGAGAAAGTAAGAAAGGRSPSGRGEASTAASSVKDFGRGMEPESTVTTGAEKMGAGVAAATLAGAGGGWTTSG